MIGKTKILPTTSQQRVSTPVGRNVSKENPKKLRAAEKATSKMPSSRQKELRIESHAQDRASMRRSNHPGIATKRVYVTHDARNMVGKSASAKAEARPLKTNKLVNAPRGTDRRPSKHVSPGKMAAGRKVFIKGAVRMAARAAGGAGAAAEVGVLAGTGIYHATKDMKYAPSRWAKSAAEKKVDSSLNKKK